MSKMPGGAMATRPLHFIWIVDCSGSMAGEKIQIVNNAIRETIPNMQEVANENVNAEVLVKLRYGVKSIRSIAARRSLAYFGIT